LPITNTLAYLTVLLMTT